MTAKIDIIDIRRSKSSSHSIPNLRSTLTEGLSKEQGNRSVSSEVLYDTVGLRLYNNGIRNDWPDAGYYLITAEKEILKLYGDEVAAELARDEKGRAVIIELGAGSLEKTGIILSCLAKISTSSEPPLITYYALDIDQTSILDSITNLQSQIEEMLHRKIETKGMWGTYDDAFHLLSTPFEVSKVLDISPKTPIHILFLGGTIGNFSKCSDDIWFLQSIKLNRERGDRWILGIDRAKDECILEQAYSEHLRLWMMNGLQVAGRTLGNESLFEKGKWERWSRYNREKGRIELGYKAMVAHRIRIPGSSAEVDFRENEIIMIMFSNKYTNEEIDDVLQHAKMEISRKWVDTNDRYYLLSLKS